MLHSVGRHTIQLVHPIAPLRSEEGEAVCDCILKFIIVGIQVHDLARYGFEFRRQFEQKLFRRRVYGAHSLYAARARPLGGVS